MSILGHAFGSTPPEPATALSASRYALGFNSDVDAIITNLCCLDYMRL